MSKAKKAGMWMVLIAVLVFVLLSESVIAPVCPDPAGACTRGIYDTSDSDFIICHDESCMDNDADTIYDYEDNCNPLVFCKDNYADCYNPNQANCDSNIDSIGDVCDKDCTTCPNPSVCALGCTIPHDELLISKDTTLCPGVYYVPDADEDGVIKFAVSNVKLDCNGAIIVSEQKCNMPGNVNRNNVLDGEDAFLTLDVIESSATVIDLCMDTNANGLGNEDFEYVINSMKCIIPGDMNYNGLLDSMDGLIIQKFIEKNVNKPCTDVNGDGSTTTDDYNKIFDVIAAAGTKYCDDVVFVPGTSCAGTWFCKRSEDKYYGGDLDYDGVITFNDLYLLHIMLNGQLRKDICAGDLDGDNEITSEDSSRINLILNGNMPLYPLSQCIIPGDADTNQYLDGYDPYLIAKAIADSFLKEKCGCCDANKDGSVDITDVNVVLDKLGREGTGIEINNKVGVSAYDCNFQRYSIGVNMTSSFATITRNVFNTTSYGIKINEGSSFT